MADNENRFEAGGYWDDKGNYVVVAEPEDKRKARRQKNKERISSDNALDNIKNLSSQVERGNRKKERKEKGWFRGLLPYALGGYGLYRLWKEGKLDFDLKGLTDDWDTQGMYEGFRGASGVEQSEEGNLSDMERALMSLSGQEEPGIYEDIDYDFQDVTGGYTPQIPVEQGLLGFLDK